MKQTLLSLSKLSKQFDDRKVLIRWILKFWMVSLLRCWALRAVEKPRFCA